jgi:GNAT superfamily N-acetyltransferase
MSCARQTEAHGSILYRALVADDLDNVPLNCQGAPEAIRARLTDLGATAILAFDGEQHIGQLQFRRYDQCLRSPDGIWDPLYWGDFGEYAPDMPDGTLSIFCYHVGQLSPTDTRDGRYQNRGIGLGLLDALIAWARANGYAALIAKHTPPFPAVMGFMGGLSAARYAQRGFRCLSSWVDPQLREVVRQRELIGAADDPNLAATVGCSVLDLR